jgi:thioredoxin 1
MSQVIEVTDQNFDTEVRQSSLPVMVDFHATWCGPCKMVAPLVEQLAAEYDGRVRFVKVDVDQAPNTAAAHRITGVPTLMFYRNGQVVDQVVGVVPPAVLKQKLETLVA